MHKGPVLSSHVVGTSSDVHVPTQGTSSYVHGVLKLQEVVPMLTEFFLLQELVLNLIILELFLLQELFFILVELLLLL